MRLQQLNPQFTCTEKMSVKCQPSDHICLSEMICENLQQHVKNSTGTTDIYPRKITPRSRLPGEEGWRVEHRKRSKRTPTVPLCGFKVTPFPRIEGGFDATQMLMSFNAFYYLDCARAEPLEIVSGTFRDQKRGRDRGRGIGIEKGCENSFCVHADRAADKN
ncbi:hypothetical protein EVAR_91743_1 [Eumeta japonica]|uniref:Uncharacterized protein n=1 Tax=Eumeta variegata TaxID=151549 RepID=A0A4C2AIW6_EUMVA|nr:hypothetical protein EVAR_91743_1 [Eumeta japonica]